MNIFQKINHEVRSLVSLDWYHSKNFGMSDLLLPSYFISDGIIKNKDGSFTTCFRFFGKDIDSTTDADLNFLSDNVINNALSRFGDGWTMHLDCIRKSSCGYIDKNACYFPDATTSIIDMERRLDYESEGMHYENDCVLTLTYLPSTEIPNKITKLYLTKSTTEVASNKNLIKFIESIAEVIEMIKSEILVKPMNNEEIMSYLNYTINGYDINFQLPKRGWIGLNYMLANQDFQAGILPKVGDKYVGVISVGAGFPFESYPALLKELSTITFEYRWSTRYIFLDKKTAQHLLNETTNYYFSSRQSISQIQASKNAGDGIARINRSADTFADQSQAAIEALETGNVNFGKYTCSVIVFDEDKNELIEKLKIIQGVLNRASFLAKIESINCFEAYLGAIPGMVRPNVRKWVMSTINLADIMPTTSVWAGYKTNPCPYYKNNNPVLFYASTEGNTPFRVCVHSGDIGHTLILGPSRTGKSTLLNFIAAQECRYKGFQQYIFDNSWSSLPLCYAVNGEHFDIGYDNDKFLFKPLEYLDNVEDFSFVQQWLEEIAILNNFQIKSEHRIVIAEVLNLIKIAAKPEQRTMSYFYLHLRPKDPLLAEQYLPYTTQAKGTSLQSTIFDASEDSLSFSRFNVFEMSFLVKQGEHIYIPAVRYIMHRIWRKLDGTPTSIKFDEIWFLIKNPIFCAVFTDIANTFAKRNCYFVISSHNMEGILNSEIRNVLLENCLTRVLLPNKAALTNEYTSKNYYLLGLNDKQINLIANSLSQLHYYYTNPDGNRLFSLGLGNVAKAFLCNTSPEDIKKAKSLKKEHQEKFGYHWLMHYSQTDAAKYWNELLKVNKC